MKYDVFISCKSEDYAKAHEAHTFLVRSGLSVFFSEVSLNQLKNADYRKSIDEALEYSQHMVVVTSSAKYVRSPWVEAEWGFFVNEKNSGRKQGNLLTLLVGSAVPADLPPSLRKYEAIRLDDAGLTRLLNFVPREYDGSEGVASSSGPQRSPGVGSSANRTIVTGVVGLVAAIGVSLCVYWFGHRSAQDNGVAAPQSLAVIPTVQSAAPTSGPSSAPRSTADALPSYPSAPPLTPPVVSNDSSKQSGSALTAATPTVPEEVTAEPLAPSPSPRAAGDQLAADASVTVTVDSDLFWDATGTYKGNAKRGLTGRIVRTDKYQARCLVAFGPPTNDSAWIAISSLEPSSSFKH